MEIPVDSLKQKIKNPSGEILNRFLKNQEQWIVPWKKGQILFERMGLKSYLGTAVRNSNVIKIYPNSSILPKYFYLDTPQNKALSLNQ